MDRLQTIPLLVVLLILFEPANAWHYFQGNKGHTGHIQPSQSIGQIVPTWEIQPEAIVQRPMVTAGDLIIMLDNDWNLIARNLGSGEVVWQRSDLGSTNISAQANTVISDGSNLFLRAKLQVETEGGLTQWHEHIISIDGKNGAPNWAKSHDDLIEEHNNQGGNWKDITHTFDILAHENSLYLSLRAGNLERMEFIAALDASSGNLQWAEVADPEASRDVVPSRFSLEGHTLYYTSRWRLYALDLSNRSRSLLVDMYTDFFDDGYPTINSAISVKNGRIYFIAGDTYTDDYRLFAYNLADEKIAFSTAVGLEEENASQLISASDARVYVMTEDAKLWAYDALGGETDWAFTPTRRETVSRSAPIIFKDRLLYASHKHGEDTSAIHCLDRLSGKEIWSVELPARIFSPFAFKDGIVAAAGDRVWALADELIFADEFESKQKDG